MRTNRTVIITGAAGGIGVPLVRRFLENGDRVVGTDLSAEALRDRLEPHDALRTVAGDISNEEDCAAVARAAEDWTGRIDVLINCAGWFPIRHIEDMTADEWRRVIDVNLTGVFLMVKAVLPALKANGWGRIISYGSGSFFRGPPDHPHYVAAKAGVIGLSRCLASDLGRYNVTANVITPGLTLTDPVRETFPPKLIEMVRMQRSLQRDQLAEDTVGAAAFLASPDADFVTGQILNVDGGSNKH